MKKQYLVCYISQVTNKKFYISIDSRSEVFGIISTDRFEEATLMSNASAKSLLESLEIEQRFNNIKNKYFIQEVICND